MNPKNFDVLLMLIGGVFPQAFMMPPRKTGPYVTSQFLKIGEVYLLLTLISHKDPESETEKHSNQALEQTKMSTTLKRSQNLLNDRRETGAVYHTSNI